MKYTRWYDKDKNLQALMRVLEALSDEAKLEVTAEILQLLMQSYSPNTDELIEELDGQYVPIRRRWYDKFENLHSAIEILRITDIEDRKEIIEEIFRTIIELLEEYKHSKDLRE